MGYVVYSNMFNNLSLLKRKCSQSNFVGILKSIALPNEIKSVSSQIYHKSGQFCLFVPNSLSGSYCALVNELNGFVRRERRYYFISNEKFRSCNKNCFC